MIKINLLPQLAGSKKSTQVPIFVGSMLILAVLIIGALWIFQNSRENRIKGEIAQLQAEKKELEPKMRDLKQQLEELETREKAISELAGLQRMLWSKKLNGLAILVPENVKFTRIYTETQAGKSLLKLEGVSYSRNGEERVEQISKLMKALKNQDFYNKSSGDPNFGEIEFIELQRLDEIEKRTGLTVGRFLVQMEII